MSMLFKRSKISQETYKDFSTFAAEANLQLDRDVGSPNYLSQCYTPHRVLTALARAAQKATCERTPLVDEAIDPRLATSTSLRALVGVLNASRERAPAELDFPVYREHVGACAHAERFHTISLMRMREHDRHSQVIAKEGDGGELEPLFISKASGLRNLLVVGEGASINGIPVEPGMLVGAPMDRWRHHSQAVVLSRDAPTARLPELGLIRQSLFGLTLGERDILLKRNGRVGDIFFLPYEKKEAKFFLNTPLTEIRDMARACIAAAQSYNQVTYI